MLLTVLCHQHSWWWRWHHIQACSHGCSQRGGTKPSHSLVLLVAVWPNTLWPVHHKACSSDTQEVKKVYAHRYILLSKVAFLILAFYLSDSVVLPVQGWPSRLYPKARLLHKPGVWWGMQQTTECKILREIRQSVLLISLFALLKDRCCDFAVNLTEALL